MPQAVTKPKKPQGFALVLYLDKMVARLPSLAREALTGRPEGTHEARTTTRRLGAAIRLLHPVLGEKDYERLAKTLRQLRRRLGPMRDLDVMIEALQTISRGKHAEAARWIAERLSQERERALERARDELDVARVAERLAVWQNVRPMVERERASVHALLAEALQTRLKQFGEYARAMEEGGAADRADPHELRIIGKALRYTLEVAQAEGLKVPTSAERGMKRIHSLLGAWHDRVVLAEQAARVAVEHELAHHDLAMMRKVLAFAADTSRKAEADLADFHEFWKEQGGRVAREIERSCAGAAVAGEADVHAQAPAATAIETSPAAVTQVSRSDHTIESQTDPGPPG